MSTVEFLVWLVQLSRHSIDSTRQNMRENPSDITFHTIDEVNFTNSCLPLHSCPLPVYPLLHVQVQPPSVSIQEACAWQSSISAAHSSKSGSEKERCSHIQRCVRVVQCCMLYYIQSLRNDSVLPQNMAYGQYWDIDDGLTQTCSPLQVSPSPVYPLLHVQVQLPSVFIHMACSWHESVPAEHSSISDSRHNKVFMKHISDAMHGVWHTTTNVLSHHFVNGLQLLAMCK